MSRFWKKSSRPEATVIETPTPNSRAAGLTALMSEPTPPASRLKRPIAQRVAAIRDEA
jgi:hypothetical protein